MAIVAFMNGAAWCASGRGSPAVRLASSRHEARAGKLASCRCVKGDVAAWPRHTRGRVVHLKMNGASSSSSSSSSSSAAPPASGQTLDETASPDELLTKLSLEAVEAMNQCDDLRELQNLRAQFLGKKGSVSGLSKQLGKLPKEARPAFGAAVNAAKSELERKFDERKEALEDIEINKQITDDMIDVTLPGTRRKAGFPHPLRVTMQKALDVFIGLGYELIDSVELSPEIETDYFCFEALNCPEDHPARDMQDTLYITDDQKMLLRTHTSSVQARYMQQNSPPFAIVCPGRVYRRDDIDATHSFQFHQMEIMFVSKDVTLGQLRATVIHFLEQMFGTGIETRFRASYFPFTEPSMEVDVMFKGKWLEVLGCGLVDPAVLEKAGYDPEEWTGFAAGFGIERFAMVIHEIKDIREFTNNNFQFLNQFSYPEMLD
ncbi:Phenylalanine--tRNA ligase alpha subunit [Porphyridium purpureum]|uniref:Phenylalanine--tRNA ligase alpha subunit n=1 Tax=Porphyridium purpureum TaxID=35688 RepID=A0A5J4YS28_PORPP|nr:Phenylalanine--tRNA ligase alpha subunit [Porphyridium purpureum]|eukprot:POR9653..scf229_5